MQENAHLRKTMPFGMWLALSVGKEKLRPNPALQGALAAMYLLFVPPVLAFVGIFAISLRNQFARYTNL
jgi:hypothetical protein